ncbi:MAG TPA: HipA domain-containing protein [Noviherbaspirillum sp.]|uniref:type II toxin-antitoxin system HipA family toxin n=1 Tax=Noviherbaspirillum sp. TaxID=1926288 RepID=UPI002DDCABF8|nr:HipA domain-containing protein [Noviherbaspirillum sp.]HEV2610771.1 HipA domain-containing protein [Noviherbaspirillum sp.]
MTSTIISKPIYVYLQRPDNGEWVTVGRYRLDREGGIGTFLYAPSYVEAGLSWSVDPVNLPLIAGHDYVAPRYGGLHDVLRDANPDAWGKSLLQKAHQLPTDAHESRYLLLASNADRWGALAFGTSKTPSVDKLKSPRLPQLEALSQELLAIAERRPPIDAKLRKRLVATPSLGGARPKATIQDGETFWLVKPYLPTDIADIPLLEHVSHECGELAGLNFAKTVLHRLGDGLSVVRILRFDRDGDRRRMAVSGASLLQTEYPAASQAEASRWSYPRLAEELRRIGAPDEDRKELFGRMVFNAVIGNDDDHPRNHAVVFNPREQRWRLSPAFDVVPNLEETPKSLTLQLSSGANVITRAAILGDAIRFGFLDPEEADRYLDALLARIQSALDRVASKLTADLGQMLVERVAINTRTLS